MKLEPPPRVVPCEPNIGWVPRTRSYNIDRRRLGYTMRYLSAEVKVVPERNVGHRLWLARGRPVADNRLENA